MAGFPWAINIDLADVWRADIEWTKARDEVVKRLRASDWMDRTTDPLQLEFNILRLEQVTDMDQFDKVWDEIYDLADEDLVWLGTF